MNDWIEWNGGEIPVSGDTLVQIECKNEQAWPRNAEDDDAVEAKNFRWKHLGLGGDIIKYRVVPE